jgi:histidine triad (HIT) family protein
MSADFYCDEVRSGKTPVEKVFETENVLAYNHTRPFWETHIVVVPKPHVDSLLTVENDLLIELLEVAKKSATKVVEEKGAACADKSRRVPGFKSSAFSCVFR